MRAIDFFERTYVINVAKRTDRRREVTAVLRSAGIPIMAGKVEFFSAATPVEPAGFPSAAVRGCVLSHFGILQVAREQHLRNVLIAEDDLELSEHFIEDQEQVVEQLQATEWGIVYLGHVEPVHGSPPTRLVRIPAEKGVLTTHFYGVNGPVIGRLFDFLEVLQRRPPGHALGGPMYPDGAISTFRKQNPDVVTLIASPILGRQRSSRSDLNPAWFDRIPLLREAAGGMRRAKRWLGIGKLR